MLALPDKNSGDPRRFFAAGSFVFESAREAVTLIVFAYQGMANTLRPARVASIFADHNFRDPY